MYVTQDERLALIEEYLPVARRIARKHGDRRHPDDAYGDALLALAETCLRPDLDFVRARALICIRMTGAVIDGMRRYPGWSRSRHALRSQTLSLDSFLATDDGPLYLPAIQDDPWGRVDARLSLRVLLAVLTCREREAIVRYYLGGEMQTSIAQDWGVTPARVTQVVSEAIAKMGRQAQRGKAS